MSVAYSMTIYRVYYTHTRVTPIHTLSTIRYYSFSLAVCVCVGFMGAVHGMCVSHADEMKNRGLPNNKEGLHHLRMCSSLAATLTRPRLSPSLADTPCTIYHIHCSEPKLKLATQ